GDSERGPAGTGAVIEVDVRRDEGADHGGAGVDEGAGGEIVPRAAGAGVVEHRGRQLGNVAVIQNGHARGQPDVQALAAADLEELHLEIVDASRQRDGAGPRGGALVEVVVDDGVAVDPQHAAIVRAGAEGVGAVAGDVELPDDACAVIRILIQG